MELHSYAKLRGYKKWTIEQKRKLVEARINYDGIFLRKSSNCMDSWKKIISAAKLNDFNVCFVRKQWANLLARYKAYKRTRLRQLGKSAGELNDQIVREISEEWEFFYPIHSFMSRKTTNFHSYAQTPRAIDGSSSNSNAHDDEDDNPTLVSLPVIKEESKKQIEITVPPNTDHDFYSKSAHREVFDNKMEADEPHRTAAATATATVTTSTINATAARTEENCKSNSINHPKEENKVQNLAVATKKKKKRKPSERDKYYKHKRRYDRRNERRFDALLNVFGQIVKEHYPNVDTSKLEAQSDMVSTEDEDATMSMCSVDSGSTYTASPSASDESAL